MAPKRRTRIESIFSTPEESRVVVRGRWKAALGVDGKVDPARIAAPSGARIQCFSVGHADELTARHGELAARSEDVLDGDARQSASAIDDILLRGCYLLAEGEMLARPLRDGLIVSEDEMTQDEAPRMYTTAALRGAAAAGRLLTPEEISRYEVAEKQAEGRSRARI